MEPRVASWRYRKGGANLLANLGAAAGAAGGEGEEEEGEEDDVVLEGETADRAEEVCDRIWTWILRSSPLAHGFLPLYCNCILSLCRIGKGEGVN